MPLWPRDYGLTTKAITPTPTDTPPPSPRLHTSTMQLSSVLAAALLVASCDALICKEFIPGVSTARTDKFCAAGVTKCMQGYFPNVGGGVVVEGCGACNRPL